MPLLVRIAIRNIRRHFRRSFLTVGSIALGLAIVLWLQCLMAGRNQNVISKITSTYTGDLQIYKKGYLKNRMTSDHFQFDLGQLSALKTPGLNWSPRVHLPGLISSGESSVPIQLDGVNPELESRITQTSRQVVKGSYLSPEKSDECESREILIGQELANLLNVKLGNKVVFMAQTSDGSLGSELFRVKGIYESQSPDFDKKIAFSPIECVQKIASIKGFHSIVFKLADANEEIFIRNKINALLNKKLESTSWREVQPSVASLIKFNDATLLMISTMLISVIIIGVINTFLMNIFERTQEFGVMLALGVRPAQLRQLILIECALLGIASIFLGTIIGLAMVFYHIKYGFDLSPFLGKTSYAGDFFMDIVIFPIVYLPPFIKDALATFVCVLLAGFYPAMRASLLNPVETMKR